MRLYLVRHGKAEAGPEEADRHLSERGRADVEAVAKYLAKQDIAVGKVGHSGLSRARETAEVLAAKLAPKVELEEIPGIEPWGDVRAFRDLAEGWTADAMVCGHEPFMGKAASLLMCGDAHAGLVEVKTGTVMALERGPGEERWYLRWMLTPRLVRGPKAHDE